MENKYKYDIEKSKDGYSLLKIIKDKKNIYSSSKYNVKREIEKIISKIEGKEDLECAYIFGLSSGEYIEDLIKCKYKGKVVIIDYFEDLVNTYSEKYKNEKNIEIITFDKIKDKDLRDEKVDCFIYGNYEAIFSNEILKATKLIKQKKVYNAVNINTIKYFSKIWVENIISNIPHLEKTKYINDYKNCYVNKPAIIVSAGPSLEKNLHLLKGVEENFIIISGGRTLPTLKANNIKVDFTCVVDGGKASYDVIKDGLDYDTKLVYNMLIYKNILDEFKGEKVCFSVEEYSMFFQQIIKELPDVLYCGGSVAHTSVDFAKYMGCNPIIMIGQDLSYTNNKFHADNASIEKNNDIENDDIDLMVENVYGEMVPTSYVLESFIRSFEEYIENTREEQDISFINCSEGGAKISGTKFMNLEDIVKVYDQKINKSFDTEKRYEVDMRHVYNNLKNIINECKDMINLCDKSIKYNRELKRIYNKNNERVKFILSELDNIDEKIQIKKSILSIIWTLVDEVARDVVKEYEKINLGKEKKSLDFVVRKGIMINKGIKESINSIIPLINKTLESLELNNKNT